MPSLFDVLDGFISNVGDLVNDRAEIEERLQNTDEIHLYAESFDDGGRISEADAVRISKAGLEWVRSVNEGNGEWGRMRHEAMAALDD